jgi:hypothetical protein
VIIVLVDEGDLYVTAQAIPAKPPPTITTRFFESWAFNGPTSGLVGVTPYLSRGLRVVAQHSGRGQSHRKDATYCLTGT